LRANCLACCNDLQASILAQLLHREDLRLLLVPKVRPVPLFLLSFFLAPVLRRHSLSMGGPAFRHTSNASEHVSRTLQNATCHSSKGNKVALFIDGWTRFRHTSNASEHISRTLPSGTCHSSKGNKVAPVPIVSNPTNRACPPIVSLKFPSDLS
jgi:hypothetical protein